MQTFHAVVEQCTATGLLVGWAPGLPGAHSQGATLEELRANLAEVLAMLSEDGAGFKERRPLASRSFSEGSSRRCLIRELMPS